MSQRSLRMAIITCLLFFSACTFIEDNRGQSWNGFDVDGDLAGVRSLKHTLWDQISSLFVRPAGVS